ncbi:D-alanyl-D-alanine carboxypeptidase [Alicyclobacillaceae bacterium I2511]|nr:D-alanyl-D-alanine carboxypeptidase [Alicyclobacillaceae bacterium I2511]
MPLKSQLGLTIGCTLYLVAFVAQPVAAAMPQAVPLATNVEIQVQAPSNSGEDRHPPALAALAKTAVIMDNVTGTVLFQKNPHQRLPLASVTKIMTLLLIMESIDRGQLSYQDRVKVSEHAASMGGAQVFLAPGETMTVADMVKCIAIASANDACVAMAEHLAGSEEQFVWKMNQRAKQLNMRDTHFINCNGLPAENHYSSAYDIALMSQELLKHPQITQFTSKFSDYLRQNTDHPFWLVNTNKLVRYYEGLDGLKTGYTAEARYCLAATAQREGFRPIVVVMGEPRAMDRNREVTQMLNWSFANYSAKVIYNIGQQVTTVNVRRSTHRQVKVYAGGTLGVVEKKGESMHIRTEIVMNSLEAPLYNMQQVGVLKAYNGERLMGQVPLVIHHQVGKATWWNSFGETFKDIITFGP